MLEDDRSPWHPALDVPTSAQPKDVDFIEFHLLVTAPSLTDYVRGLGAREVQDRWRLPFASEAWILSRLRELTGKIQVTAPEHIVELYQGWLLETLSSYDS